MLKKFPYVLLLAVLSAASVHVLRPSMGESVTAEEATTPTLADLKKQAKQDGIDRAIAWDYQLTKDPATGAVPVSRLVEVKKLRDQLLATKRLNPLAPVTGISWTERGPDNVGGRSRVAWFDLGDAANGYKKVWAAGVGGGLWFCNDITAATPVWNKVNDFFDNIAITSFAQAAGNPQTMYFGTGEGWFNGDAIEGLGIWKSTDGGTTWNRLMSTASFVYVQDLALDAAGNLYAALRGRTVSHAVGIRKSTDGGNSWTQVLGSPVLGSSSRGADIEIAANGDVYASIGFFANGRIFRSAAATHGADVGNVGTWTEITPDPSTNVIPLASASDAYDRIELAVAPNNANIVYAVFEGNGTQNANHIKRYNAGTNSWSNGTVPSIIDQGSNSNFTRGQAWYDLIAAVDPNNESSLWIGGVDGLRSDNNGVTWQQNTTWSLFAATGFTTAQNVHADHHYFMYAPGSSSRMVVGTDGGVDYTENASVATPTKPTFIDKNKGYNVTQFYAVANHPTDPNFYLAGAQDNGSHRFTTAGMNSTTEVTGGDGAFCHIDQNEPNIQITSYVYNNYYVSTNGGASFTGRFKANTGGFINPTDYDDFANILYGGNNGGTYFRYISPATDGATANVSVTNFAGGSVTHVSVSPTQNNRVYFGLNNGRVVMVDNAHTGAAKTGTVVFNQGISGSVSCVAIDPANENHLLVSFSNYGVNSLWETINGGLNWTSVEGNFPDMPVRWAMFDPRNSDWALLATEMGVWSTDNLNGGATAWDPTNTGLANVRVDMLQYSPLTRVLSAATHGRGLYTATVPARTTTDINFAVAKGLGAEQSTGTIDCRRFTDYSVNLTISKAPVGDANVTVNLGAGTTARRGVDFDFTTNGSFTSPSNVAVFPNGSSSSRTVTIRVYDDTELEEVENVELVYAVGGTTDAINGAGPQAFSMAITDNDAAPVPTGVATVSVGSSDNTSANSQPFRGNFEVSKTQMLYTAAELRATGLTAGPITRIGFDVTAKNTNGIYQNITIKMAQTSATQLGTAAMETGLPTVHSMASYSTVLGANDFTLSSPINWDGTSNLIVEFCFANDPGFNPGGTSADVVRSSVTTPVMAKWVRGNNSTCDAISGTIFSSFSGIGNMRPVLRVRGNVSGVPVATAINTNGTYNFGPFAHIYIYSTGGELLALLRNLSSHDYGCTEVRIDRAGDGAKALRNNTPADFVTDKTLVVNPTNNNPNGQYEVTLYYTASEVAGWEAATGRTWAAAQMVKTRNAVSSYTPGTVPQADIDINPTPVKFDFGSSKGIRATFGTGFSGFAVGVPDATLPVTWLDVKATAGSDHNLISWATGTEQGNARFDVQISRNGRDFVTIGQLKGRGNSSRRQDYNYRHLRPEAGTNFYRIQQVDVDGRSSFSQVVSVRSANAANTKAFIYPTVGSQLINLNMGRLVEGRIQWEIFSADMKLVHRGPVLSSFVQGGINIEKLAGGTYFLRVNTAEGTEMLRFVKQ